MVSDINAKDTEGNTALHAAVEQDQKKSLDFLLAHKADPTILNKRAMAPIHLAVDLDRTDTLEASEEFDVKMLNRRPQN